MKGPEGHRGAAFSHPGFPWVPRMLVSEVRRGPHRAALGVKPPLQPQKPAGSRTGEGPAPAAPPTAGPLAAHSPRDHSEGCVIQNWGLTFQSEVKKFLLGHSGLAHCFSSTHWTSVCLSAQRALGWSQGEAI